MSHWSVVNPLFCLFPVNTFPYRPCPMNLCHNSFINRSSLIYIGVFQWCTTILRAVKSGRLGVEAEGLLAVLNSQHDYAHLGNICYCGFANYAEALPEAYTAALDLRIALLDACLPGQAKQALRADALLSALTNRIAMSTSKFIGEFRRIKTKPLGPEVRAVLARAEPVLRRFRDEVLGRMPPGLHPRARDLEFIRAQRYNYAVTVMMLFDDLLAYDGECTGGRTTEGLDRLKGLWTEFPELLR